MKQSGIEIGSSCSVAGDNVIGRKIRKASFVKSTCKHEAFFIFLSGVSLLEPGKISHF